MCKPEDYGPDHSPEADLGDFLYEQKKDRDLEYLEEQERFWNRVAEERDNEQHDDRPPSGIPPEPFG